MDSILLTVRSTLGVETDYEGFDPEIILAINTGFMTLNQLGVGPVDGYKISDDTEVWTDFLEEETNLEAVKTYICLKSRLLFDPTTSSFLIEAIKNQISEIEWRLMVQTEPPTEP